MEIGTIHTISGLTARTERSALRQLVERIQAAEQSGFYSSWLTEHHFANDPEYRPYGLDVSDFYAYDLSGDPLTILSHVAAKTDRIRLGTGVVVPHYDNPLRIAERAAIVDNLSGGRLELGLGRGNGKRTYGVFDVKLEGNRDKFGEAIEIIQAAWSGNRFGFDGRYYSVPEIRVVPRPLQAWEDMIFVAASSPETMPWLAARGISYCYVAGAFFPVALENYPKQRAEYLAAGERAGHDLRERKTPHAMMTYCAETDEEALALAREHIFAAQVQAELHYEFNRYAGEGPASAHTTASREALEAKVDSLIGLNLVGSPETCRRLIERYRDVMGINYLLCMVDQGAIPHEKVLRSIELLGERVLPHFEEKP